MNTQILTSMDTHTHMADPAEVMLDLWLFGLLCYFNVCCCTWGDTQTHPTAWQRGPITIPMGEDKKECVCLQKGEQ